MAAIDALDRRLLEELQGNSALSYVELAQRVHASAATCLRRVRVLHEQGLIERQVAIVAPEALGATLTALVEVTLDAQNAERLDGFENLVVREPAITQCYRLSPGPDFLLILTVTDMPAYQALAHRLFTAQHHVRNLRVFFSVKRSKFDTRVPLPPAAT